MVPRVLADAVMLVHFGFVLFVALGGLLVLVRRWVAWLHVPCVLYGAALEFFGWVCPLTPLEAELRREAGQAGYSGSFIEHYLEGILYPAGWSDIHVWLGVAALLWNGLIYGWVLARDRPAGGVDAPDAAGPSGPGQS